MLEYIVLVITALPSICGKVSHNLTVPCGRHLHYLTLARFPVIQYCCRLLLLAIKVSRIKLNLKIFRYYCYIYNINNFIIGKLFFTRWCWRFGDRTCISFNAN